MYRTESDRRNRRGLWSWTLLALGALTVLALVVLWSIGVEESITYQESAAGVAPVDAPAVPAEPPPPNRAQ